MALTERHRWCVGKIVETFKPEIDTETVQNFIRNDKILSKFTTFFRGESAGRMFVFYQSDSAVGSVHSEVII